MISIIIPTWKKGKYLIQTIDSILSQTFKDFEIIVIDNGLYQEAKNKLNKYLTDKNNIKLLKEERAGAPAARNRGFSESKGDFLFFCDDDIILKKNALGKMVEALNKHPEASYVYCDFYLGFKLFKSFDFDAEKLKKIPYISAMSLIRREHFPGWDESLKKFQDWDLWLTMLEKGHYGYHLSEVLFKAIPQKQGISNWLPRFFYKIPWGFLPIKPRVIKDYRDGVKTIKKKHNLY